MQCLLRNLLKMCVAAFTIYSAAIVTAFTNLGGMPRQLFMAGRGGIQGQSVCQGSQPYGKRISWIFAKLLVLLLIGATFFTAGEESIVTQRKRDA